MNLNRLAAFAAVTVVAGAQAQTITQNTSQAIVAGNSVSCANGLPGHFHADMYFARRFTLSSHGITQPWMVSNVTFGVEYSEGVFGSLTQDLTVDLFDGGTAAALGPIAGSKTFAVADGRLFLQSVDVSGLISSGTLWARIYYKGDADSLFFMGSNPAGQSDPSYMRADRCNLPVLTDISTFGFPDMHIVMNVTGAPVPEPATMVATAIGVVGLIRRRRSNR